MGEQLTIPQDYLFYYESQARSHSNIFAFSFIAIIYCIFLFSLMSVCSTAQAFLLLINPASWILFYYFFFVMPYASWTIYIRHDVIGWTSGNPKWKRGYTVEEINLETVFGVSIVNDAESKYLMLYQSNGKKVEVPQINLGDLDKLARIIRLRFPRIELEYR